jgi:hypothetical protein
VYGIHLRLLELEEIVDTNKLGAVLDRIVADVDVIRERLEKKMGIRTPERIFKEFFVEK